MMTEDDDDTDDGFDQEASQWFSAKQAAEARRAAARGNMPTVDPTAQRAIAARLAAQAARAAAVTPGSLTGGGDMSDPFSLPSNVKVTVPTPAQEQEAKQPPAAPTGKTPSAQVAPVATATQTDITFWVVELTGGEKLYAESWDTMKTMLATHPGEWTAKEHSFKNTSHNILGFFVPEQYAAPSGKVNVCEVIVANGKVYKAEA